MDEDIDFPELPDAVNDDPRIELKKIRYQAECDALQAQAAADDERRKAMYAAEYAHVQAVDDAYIEVTKGAIQRVRDGADFVQKAAVAVGTLYTGALAYAFRSAADSAAVTGQAPLIPPPLPIRGLVPILFLAIAIGLSTAYLAFFGSPNWYTVIHASALLRENQVLRLDAFRDWAMHIALDRGYLLRTSVISLGVGILTLPVAFLDIADSAVLGLTLAVITIMLVLLLREAASSKSAPDPRSAIPKPATSS